MVAFAIITVFTFPLVDIVCVCQGLKVEIDSLESRPVSSSVMNTDIFSIALAARLIAGL